MPTQSPVKRLLTGICLNIAYGDATVAAQHV